MPAPGKRWRHVIISTHSSWLPGDRRGWRSRHHKRHSSGDYKNPPPPEEHAGLRRYSEDISGSVRIIPFEVRPLIGRALLRKLAELEHRVLSASVADKHAHLLVELPADIDQVTRIIGRCKQAASLSVTRVMPGQVWAEGGKYKPVDTASHQDEVYHYILEKQGPDAWTWSYEQGIPK